MNKPRNVIDIFIEEKVSEAYRPIVEKFRGLIQREFPCLIEEYDDAMLRYYILQGIEHDEEIKAGIVHEVSKDIEVELKANIELLHLWNKLTPIQRNEWICWVPTQPKCVEVF